MTDDRSAMTRATWTRPPRERVRPPKSDRRIAVEAKLAELHARLDVVESSVRLLTAGWRKQRAINEALVRCSDVFVDGRGELLAAIHESNPSGKDSK